MSDKTKSTERGAQPDNTLVITLRLRSGDTVLQTERIVALEQIEQARIGLVGIHANDAWSELVRALRTMGWKREKRSA